MLGLMFGQTKLETKTDDANITYRVLPSAFSIGIGRSDNYVSMTIGGYSLISKRFFQFTSNSYFRICERNTYDFSDDLFNDEDRGEAKASSWLVAGSVNKLSNKSLMFIGGGIASIEEYYKRYDSTQILGNDGEYYLEQDKHRYTPTLYLGIATLLDEKNMIGMNFNLIPMDFSVMWYVYI